jgi:hypothetical protein
VPNYKYWCCGNGKLYGIEEGLLVKNQFYSKEYYFDKDWFKKAWEEKNLIVANIICFLAESDGIDLK